MAVLNNLFKIIHSKFAFFKSKLRFFVKILMKFCRNFTNMLRMSRIFNFLKKKDPIFGKIRENFGNVPIIQKIIQNYSVVSLLLAVLLDSPLCQNAEHRAFQAWHLLFAKKMEEINDFSKKKCTNEEISSGWCDFTYDPKIVAFIQPR